MKTSLLTFFSIFLLTLSLSAQQLDDHYIVTNTHDTTVTTLWQNVIHTETLLLSIRFAKHNSDYALELKFNFGKGPEFIVPKGDSIMIKFVSGWGFSKYAKDSIISGRGLSAIPGSLAGAVTEGAYVSYPLTFGEVAALAAESVEKIRIYSSRGFDNCLIQKLDRWGISQAALTVSQPIKEWVKLKYKPDESLKIQKDSAW